MGYGKRDQVKSLRQLRQKLLFIWTAWHLPHIVMAGMCGLEAGRKILCQWPDARILVVSALVYDDVIEEINEFGDKGIVAEPFNRDNLLEAMRKAVA